VRDCLLPIINTIIKPTSVCDASSVGGGRGWLTGDTDGLAGWPLTVDVDEVGVVDTPYGVSQPGAETLSGTGARVYTAHRGWLSVVTGISAASTGGVLVIIDSYYLVPIICFRQHKATLVIHTSQLM